VKIYDCDVSLNMSTPGKLKSLLADRGVDTLREDTLRETSQSRIFGFWASHSIELIVEGWKLHKVVIFTHTPYIGIAGWSSTIGLCSSDD
jgi:hypothetical protein